MFRTMQSDCTLYAALINIPTGFMNFGAACGVKPRGGYHEVCNQFGAPPATGYEKHAVCDTDTWVDESFEATFELNLRHYWTVVTPALECCAFEPGGQWYDERMALTHGVFFREQDAHTWARERLLGGPYSIRFCEFSPENYD